MARKRRSHAVDAEPARIALEHGIRRWEAEVENDRKLSQRENGLLAFVAAVLGLSLFKLELLAAPDPSSWFWIVRGLVGTSLIFLLGALAKFLLTPERDSAMRPGTQESRTELTALPSEFLRWPELPDRPYSGLTDSRAAILEACELTTRAATSLHIKNLDRVRAIDRGEILLSCAAVLAALAFVCYVWSHAR